MKKHILNLTGAKTLSKGEQKDISGGYMLPPYGFEDPHGGNGGSGGGSGSGSSSNCTYHPCGPGKCYDMVYCRCQAGYPASGNGIC